MNDPLSLSRLQTHDSRLTTTKPMTYAKITGTGSFVPEKVLTNETLSLMLGEDINEFVSQEIGIRERHICAENESTADLATEAAKRAIDAANLSPEDLDLIILYFHSNGSAIDW